MINAQTIAEFYGGRLKGKSWRCRCPIHNGNSNDSLVLTDTGRETPLVHCFSGCDFKDIIARFRSDGLWIDSTQSQSDMAKLRHQKEDIEHAQTIMMIAKGDFETGVTHSNEDLKTIEHARSKLAPANLSSKFYNTDMANAERFARLHADYVYWTPERGWLLWDGQRWKIDAQGMIMRLAKQTAREILSELKNVHGEHTDLLYKWAKRSQSKDRLNAMLALAQSEQCIPAHITDFDTDPMLLNCNNGALDLASGKLLTHSPSRMLSKFTPIKYKSRATCPLWLSFLNRVMDNDSEMINFLQRAVGYTLTGHTGEQCLFFTHGTGANGKSVFLEILLQLAGEYGTNARADSFMIKTQNSGIPNDIARLVGMRFVGVNETETGQRMAESLVKDMTGGDTITARFLHKEFFSFRPEFKLWIRGNHKPNIRGTDDGIWRRIHLIPFDVQIPEAERDRELPNKLQRELPGILRWAAEGVQLWQRDGLMVPEKVMAATSEYRTEMDRLADFIAEKCTTGSGFSAFAGKLYKGYHNWCDESGESPMTQTAFGLALGERGFTKKTSGGRRKYYGIGLCVKDYRDRDFG